MPPKHETLIFTFETYMQKIKLNIMTPTLSRNQPLGSRKKRPPPRNTRLSRSMLRYLSCFSTYPTCNLSIHIQITVDLRPSFGLLLGPSSEEQSIGARFA
jgi:hypothetical protein